MTAMAMKIKSLNLTWNSWLNQQFWDGTVDIWMGKGYICLSIPVEERKRLFMSDNGLLRIEEVLQKHLDKVISYSATKEVLSSLALVDEIRIPNVKSEQGDLYKELCKEGAEVVNQIGGVMKNMVPHFQKREYSILLSMLEGWRQSGSFASLKKGASILAQALKDEAPSNQSFKASDFSIVPSKVWPLWF